MHAFGSFFGMVVDVTVNGDGEVAVNRVVCAVDCGMVVNPNTIEAQVQGGIIFGITAALYSEITIKDGRVEQIQLHRLPDAADRSDAAHRSAYREEQRGARGHRRTGHGSARARADQRDFCRHRQALAAVARRPSTAKRVREPTMIKQLVAALGAASSRWLCPCWPMLPRNDDPLVARGAYLAKVGDCVACHSAPKGKPFAGGLPMTTPMGKIYTTNITPDPDTGIGKWSEEDFEKALREGVAKDGHNLYPAMPYPSYAKVRDDDVKALYAYFMKGVAPVNQANRPSDIPFPLNMRWPLKFWNMVFLDKGVYRDKDGQGRRVESRRLSDPGPGPLRLVPHASRHRVPGEGAR